MKFSRRVTLCFLIALATTACASITLSQQPVTCRLWIQVWNPDTDPTLEFGNDVHATYFRDDGTNGTYDLFEWDCQVGAPPPPWSIFWRSIPGRPGNAFGIGFCNRDYRSIPSDSVRRDTFKLFFQDPDMPDSTFYFSWPDASYLGARCDSLFFTYRDSTNGPQKIDMFKQNVLEIPAATTRGITYALIYKFGMKLIDAAETNEGGRPNQFVLYQNHPNPFNPSTEIRYHLPAGQAGIADFSYVDIRVYDVLGRELGTLVRENQQPGLHVVSWDASRFSSGLYFYKLSAFPIDKSARPFFDVKKMIVVK